MITAIISAMAADDNANFGFKQSVTAVGMYKYMAKVVIKILQGSAVAQTVLGGLTIYPLVANFL